jgi:hypothetical protein
MSTFIRENLMITSAFQVNYLLFIGWISLMKETANNSPNLKPKK